MQCPSGRESSSGRGLGPVRTIGQIDSVQSKCNGCKNVCIKKMEKADRVIFADPSDRLFSKLRTTQ